MRKRKPTADEMLVRMAGLCAGAEQCSADIRAKILKQGFSFDEAEKMLDYLCANKYIDDARYARAYAVDKVRFSGWGRLKIRMGLRTKALSDVLISQSLECIPIFDYKEMFQKIMESKARCLDLSDVKDRQKLYRYMASRGFESQLIISGMREMLKKSGL
ncbi:MAG: RecX family transcriptional regulator [Allobaculum sp.]|nr:RecX family transcriptional regulator [Allobaculum sp.]